MAGYEYRYENIDGANWIDRLNALGAEGWKIINFQYHDSVHVHAMFERGLPDKPDGKGGLLGQTEAEREGKSPDVREDTAPSVRFTRTPDPAPPEHPTKQD